MIHDTPLISTIVAGLVLAFIFGAIAHRFRMPPLVGYLFAGVLVGPYTPGFVANGELATELSEIGVILLMFGVGLHFSLKDLLSVRSVAIPGAIVQIAGATMMGLGLATLLGWSIGAGLIFGLALSVASTVVLLKALQDRRLVDSERGRIAVGWLIVEDLAMVLALVLIPAIAGLAGITTAEIHDPFVNFVETVSGVHLNLFAILGITIVKLAAFVGFMLVVGRRVIPYILHATAHTGSRELFRLAVLAIALGVAAGASYLFGVSLALGAFFAGMILSESELSQRAAQESLPLRDAFSVLFFVAVGMLFDPMILIREPLPVLATVFIIVFGKSALAFLIVAAFRRPPGTALMISASLAQIGEFSFILAALGVSLGILPSAGRDLILAGAIISIVLNPLFFWVVDWLRPRLEARLTERSIVFEPQTDMRTEPSLGDVVPGPVEPVRAQPAEAADESSDLPTHKSGHVILVGYGRVGTVAAEGLLKSQSPFVLIEDAEGRVNAARAAGIEVIVGNAASPETLSRANVTGARIVLIAIPNAFEAGQVTEQCRRLNPEIRIISRAHSDQEIDYLRHLGANHVIMGEREIGLGMLGWINGENDHAEVTARQLAGLNAVAAALKIEPAAVVVPAPKPAPLPPQVIERLEAEIEAAQVQHIDSGPAEPPMEVPALGEMLDGDADAASSVEGSAAAEVEPEPEEPGLDALLGGVVTPEPAAPRVRPVKPATTAATPFNPEVPPEDSAA